MKLQKIRFDAIQALIQILDEVAIHDVHHVKRLFNERFLNFDEIVVFLSKYSLVQIQNNEIYNVASNIDIRKRIIALMADIRKDYELLDRFIFSFNFTENGFAFAPNPEQVVIFADERIFLTSLGVLRVNKELLVLNDPSLMVDNLRRGLSQDRLKKLIDQDQIIGERAETIVLNMEKKHIKDTYPHLPSDVVLQVSTINAEIGYDILSLDDETNDYGEPKLKYIEVKATSNNLLSFHWSSNEIEASRKLGSQYYIYLVPDPLRLVNPKEIIIIRDAYSNIHENENWDKEVKNILFTKKRRETIKNAI